MMNHIYKFRLISMTMLCLLLSCTTPNPVEEAKVDMQKEYHAYFDNTISMIEQYNWVLSIDIYDYWYPEGATVIDFVNDLETGIQGCRRLSKEISTINIDDERVISAKQELQQVLKEISEDLVSLVDNPTNIFVIVAESRDEEFEVPEIIVHALSSLQNSIESKMNISNDIVCMREDIIRNKRLNKEQFIEINQSILTMARDSFLHHFQNWKEVDAYFDQETNYLKDSTYINNMYQFFYASTEAMTKLKKHNLYDEQTTQMYTGFYAESDAYCEPVNKATDNVTTIYKGNGFVIDFYSNALDGEGELYWNVYSCQENNGDLTLTLKKSFLYSKNNYSASIKTPDEKYIGEKYIYKSLSCGENSYAGIHISNKGKKYAEVWVETEEDKGFLRDLYLCPEVIDYLVSNKWRDK